MQSEVHNLSRNQLTVPLLIREAARFIAIALIALPATVSTAQEASAPPPQTEHQVPSYTDDIQPLFNKRCIACHGCLGFSLQFEVIVVSRT